MIKDWFYGLGTCTSWAAHSGKVIPTNSQPELANILVTRTETKETEWTKSPSMIRSVEGSWYSLNASGLFQNRNPSLSFVGPPPRTITSNIQIRPRQIQTFTTENQNSISPKNRTPRMLIEVINTKSIVTLTAGLTRSESIQYRMVKEAATNWFAATNKHEKTYVQPRANPNASSTYLRQYPVNPFCQRYEICNLSQPTQHHKNDKANHWLLINMAPWPAALKADPDRINNQCRWLHL